MEHSWAGEEDREMARVVVSAPDIECEGCAGAITRSLGKAPGVQEVSVDVDAKQVSIEYGAEQVGLRALLARLAGAGFPSTVVSEG